MPNESYYLFFLSIISSLIPCQDFFHCDLDLAVSLISAAVDLVVSLDKRKNQAWVCSPCGCMVQNTISTVKLSI